MSLLFYYFPPSFLSLVLLREEVLALQEEVAELKRMKEMLNKELEECGGGCSAELLSAAELRVQLSHRERDLDRASEALQGESALHRLGKGASD